MLSMKAAGDDSFWCCRFTLGVMLRRAGQDEMSRAISNMLSFLYPVSDSVRVPYYHKHGDI